MNKGKLTLLPILNRTVENLAEVGNERKVILQILIDYIIEKRKDKQEVNLNFICTHNSRRSQFSQIWAQTAADFYGVDAHCFSGGVEVTAFNERAVKSIVRIGFQVTSIGAGNPKYKILHSEKAAPIHAFSKLYNDETSPKENFSAIMTCSHADENCPFIPGTEVRIPVRYEDPKAYDDTKLEEAKYDERSLQIASEMFYVFSIIK